MMDPAVKAAARESGATSKARDTLNCKRDKLGHTGTGACTTEPYEALPRRACCLCVAVMM